MTNTNTETPAFEIITSPVYVDTNARASFGVLYESGRDTADCAKMIREDIARAQKFGAFAGLKVSVRIERYSMGSTVHVNITKSVGGVMRAKYATRTALDIHTNHEECYTPRIVRALRWLEMIVDQYRRDDSDMMTDYYSVNFSHSVGVDWRLESAERDHHIRAGHARVLRAALVAHDTAGALDDDRPALAVDALERGDVETARADVATCATEGTSAALVEALRYVTKASDRSANPGAVVAMLARGLVNVAPSTWASDAAKAMLTARFLAA